MTRPEDDIDEQAFGWVDLLERGPLSDEIQREFEAWLGRSPRHEGAFVRASAASVRFNRLAAFAGGRPVYTKPLQFDVRRRRVVRALALAATGVMVGGAWLARNWSVDTWRGVRYTTAVGQVWSGRFEDGTEMLLNTATEVLVQYSSDQREIRLHHGEAAFTVVPDAARPFVVRVGEWVLRAVRAAFAIRHDMRIIVTVTEGSVDMLHAELRTIRQHLVAGQEAIVDSDGLEHIRHISDEEVTRRFAWRAGTVVFDGQLLRDALVEMNRYTVRQIRCDDPNACTRQITGAFAINDIETFLLTIQKRLDLEVVSNGNLVLLTSRKNSR